VKRTYVWTKQQYYANVYVWQTNDCTLLEVEALSFKKRQALIGEIVRAGRNTTIVALSLESGFTTPVEGEGHHFGTSVSGFQAFGKGLKRSSHISEVTNQLPPGIRNIVGKSGE
jgi:hypothetical protein